MKFKIRRKPNDIDVIHIEITELKQSSFWKNWKVIGVATVAFFVIVGITTIGFYHYGLGNLQIEIKRETAVILRSKDGQERNGQGADGTTSTIHRTTENVEGKN